MTEFKSGQKLTAEDMNNIVSEAMGQNIPTDKSYIKSVGVNLYDPIKMNVKNITPNKVFDTRVRMHNVAEKDQKPSYIPFWEVYLGTDTVVSADIALYDPSIVIDNGTAFMGSVAKIFAQPLPVLNALDDYFKYSNSVVQMEGTDPDIKYKDLKQYDAQKWLQNNPQLVNSSGDGWFCTGLPVGDILAEKAGELLYAGSGLFATFARIDTDDTTHGGYDFVCVFTNVPVTSLEQLIPASGRRTLPDGSYIVYAELLGNHSAKIAGLRENRDSYFTEHLEGYQIPSDGRKKDDHNWDITTPYLRTEGIDQLFRYEILNSIYITRDGQGTSITDKPLDQYINFSEFAVENTHQADIYYAYIEEDLETGLYELKYEYAEIIEKMVSEFTSNTLRNKIPEINKYIQMFDINKFNSENLLKKRLLVFSFLVIKNYQLTDPYFWKIDYVSYWDTQPDFSRFLEEDTLTTANNTNSYQRSLTKGDVYVEDKEGNSSWVSAKQLYHFGDVGREHKDISEIKKGSVLIRKEDIGDDGTKLELDYIDLSAFTGANVQVDSDNTQYQRSIEWCESDPRFLQLWHFNGGVNATKTVEINSLSGEVDFLDSEDSILVKSGEELKYKKFKIKTNIEGSTQGYTGTQTHGTRLYWNTTNYKLELIGRDFKYENGLLKEVGNEKVISQIDTVGYTQP